MPKLSGATVRRCPSVRPAWSATLIRRLILPLAFLLPFAASPALAQRPECPSDRVAPAIAEVQGALDWAALYGMFRRYAGCDDGAIAEGYTDRVMDLLARGWERLPDLAPLVARDPAFAAFVLDHIDATADPADLRRVVSFVEGRGCPDIASDLCDAIRRHAKDALSREGR